LSGSRKTTTRRQHRRTWRSAFRHRIGQNTLAELVFFPGSRNGRGLFGASDVYVTEAASPAAGALLAEVRAAKPGWSLPVAGQTVPATLRAGQREVRRAVRRVPAAEQSERT
jgi:hypothetical protein